MNKNNAEDKRYNGSSHTFFFNIKSAKNNSKYLQITESRFDKTSNGFKRNSIFLFPNDFAGFCKTLSEIKIA